METLPVKPDRLAELEEFARRRGKSTADALDEALAEYLEWERQDYQEALEAAGAVNDIETPRVKKLETRRDRSC